MKLRTFLLSACSAVLLLGLVTAIFMSPRTGVLQALLDRAGSDCPAPKASQKRVEPVFREDFFVSVVEEVAPPIAIPEGTASSLEEAIREFETLIGEANGLSREDRITAALVLSELEGAMAVSE
ncbi:MAG: hypothetical protein AAGD22_16625 [Verrucomicrobiota bacterium]